MITEGKILFSPDPFLRDSMHREELFELEKGFNYKQAMLMIRGDNGALRPLTSSDLDSKPAVFMTICDCDLTKAPQNKSVPVVVSGSVWQSSIVLPEGVEIEQVVDLMRASNILAVSSQHKTFHANGDAREEE